MTTPYKTNYIVKNKTFLNCLFIQGSPSSVNELVCGRGGYNWSAPSKQRRSFAIIFMLLRAYMILFYGSIILLFWAIRKSSAMYLGKEKWLLNSQYHFLQTIETLKSNDWRIKELNKQHFKQNYSYWRP